MRYSTSMCLALIAAALSASCDGVGSSGRGASAGSVGGLDSTTFQLRDSSGVAIAINLPMKPSAETRWTISEVAELEFGGPAGPPGAEYQFSGPQELIRLPDSSIVVLNFGTRELRVFSSAGKHIATHGRPGRFPGEFRNMQGLASIKGDTFAILDLTQTRLMLLSANRGVERGQIVDFSALLARAEPGVTARQAIPISDTLLVVEGFRSRAGGTAGGGGAGGNGSRGLSATGGADGAGAARSGRNFTYHIVSTSGNRVLSLGPYQEPEPFRLQIGTRYASVRLPLAPRALVAVQPASHNALVCAAISSTRIVDCARPDGSRMSVRWSAPDVFVDAAFRAQWIHTQTREQQSLLRISPTEAALLTGAAPWPTYYNPIERMHIDTDGNIWIQEPFQDADTTARRYRIFNSTGVAVALANYIPLFPLYLERTRITAIRDTPAGGSTVVVHTITR